MTFNVYKGGVIVPAPLLHLKCVTNKINYLKCEGLKKCTYNIMNAFYLSGVAFRILEFSVSKNWKTKSELLRPTENLKTALT